MNWTAGALADRLNLKLRGDRDVVVSRINDLKKASAGDLSFLSSPSFRTHLAATEASVVILKQEEAERCPERVTVLVADNPYLIYARAAQLLYPRPAPEPGIHPLASVDETAEIDPSAAVSAHCCIGAGVRLGAGVSVAAGCVIEAGASIGEGSVLEPNVTIMSAVEIGKRCLIHPGAVIGADGFGFANDCGVWEKIPQVGRVVVGDDVEIGANTTIDRGAIEDTVISSGVKLDNLIQVAHNVKIGSNSAIAGCTGIAGSATIGERCAIGGGVGIVGHLHITDDVVITGQTFVAHNIEKSGTYSSGVPMEPVSQWRRNYLRFKQLDGFARRLKQLEKKLLKADDKES